MDYRDNEDMTAVDIDFCSDNIPSLIRASPFTTNNEITSGKVIAKWSSELSCTFLHLDAVQDVVTTLYDKRGS